MKKVGIIQSNYIPWRGYFNFIADVDLFIIYDDVQYTKNDWRNRNKIKIQKGTKWLSVPVKYHSSSLSGNKIQDVKIDYSLKWFDMHMRSFYENYKSSPYYDHANTIFSIISNNKFESISSLNVHLIKDIMNYLEINSEVIYSSELEPEGTKTERLIDILTKVDADVYLSGPSADAYLDKELFKENNIGLEYKTYDYEPYSQLHGDFIGNVTVLDLIANCGPDSRKYLKSKSPNQKIVMQD
ncbi:WbqC family protein [Methanoplanus sp. FWC-SCC4]|uniref:WbqC family protein n=1 Tax=Methanochimaera problematica TaxID=2609417 RepID=A0AA97I298_9EURY|nr:WbqC family protein [Methanoplanus sp. FWC-SCC4]WOF15388.1 WbqC family protein [Methanoplanus sp. FWC-SCC4]